MYKHDNFYRFKIDKKKRFKLTCKSSVIYFQIFQEFFLLIRGVETLMPFLLKRHRVFSYDDLGHTGESIPLKDVVVVSCSALVNFCCFYQRSYLDRLVGLDKPSVSPELKSLGNCSIKKMLTIRNYLEDFIYQIENRVYKKQVKMYYPRFTKFIIHHFLIQEKSLFWRKKIGMHTSKDDYLINSLRFVSAKESTQIYGAMLPKCLTSPAMKESKAYKTYLGYATVPVDEEPIQKGKRVKRHVKKSTTKAATCVVIREAHVETKSKSKEKVDVTYGKGIELLSEVALTEEAQVKEVRKKSLRDFHKTHPSSSGTVSEKPPSVDKITPTVTSKGTGDKPGVPDVTEDDSTESESESWGNDEDDSNNDDQDSSNEDIEQENESEEQVSDSKQEEESKDDDQEEEEFIHTPSPIDEKDDENLESVSDEVIKNIPHTDAEIVSPLDVHVHHEVPRTQAPTLLTIPVSVITESSPVYTKIPQSSQTFTPPPILTTPTPPPTIETTNPLSTLPDFASVFRFNDRITTLEKEVAELKKDPLHTQVTTLVDEHLDTRLGETREEFMKFLSESLTTRIKEQVKDQLPQILPKEVSNFAPPVIEELIKEIRDEVTLFLFSFFFLFFSPPVIEELIKESRDEVTLAKVSSQPHSTYEAASTLTEFELKKILLDKMEKSESYLAAPEHRDCYDSLKKSYDLDKDFFFSYDVYSLKRSRKDKDKDEDPSAGSDRGLKKRKLSKDAEPTTGLKKKDSTFGSSKGTKSQSKSSGKSVQSEEPVFEVADSDMPQDQEGNMGDNEDEPRKETASRRDWFKKPTPPQEPTDPDWYVGKTTQEG
ncbi:hypothetical protein Tco_0445895, partial [Tanacetum coccineum]